MCKDISRFKFFKNEKQYAITHDGAAAYIFEKKGFLLNIDESQAANLDAVIPKDKSEYKPARIAYTIEKGKYHYVKIENKYAHCFVDKNYLKYFENPYFEIKDKRNIVLVYEGAYLKGIVCPCKVEE